MEDIEKQLDKIQELPESDSYPLFHLLPEVVQHYAKLLTLPNELKGFVVSRRSPEECLRLSKEVAIATYEGARRLLGDAEAVVCVPPPELLQVQYFTFLLNNLLLSQLFKDCIPPFNARLIYSASAEGRGILPFVMQEPEFKARALWEGMAVLRPWDEIPVDVLAMEPQIVPEEATKDGTLNDEQKEILQVPAVTCAH